MATAPAIERAPVLHWWCRYVPGFACRPGGTERSTENGLRLSYSLGIDAPADSLALRFRNENFFSIGAPAPRAPIHFRFSEIAAPAPKARWAIAPRGQPPPPPPPFGQLPVVAIGPASQRRRARGS